MVNALDSAQSPGWGHCVVFLGEIVLPSPQMYKCNNVTRGVEIFLVASCYRNRAKLRPDGTTWLVCRLFLAYNNGMEQTANILVLKI